ncbi:MAG TPA: hypothetical protein GX724_01385 [Fibrobacter sp.]|nr:hypothetical protein [Fibrobacter sp.]
MGGIPPLRYIRKTALIITVVFLSFFIHRTYVNFESDSPEIIVDALPLLSPEQSVVCRNVVSGVPLGVDSVFKEKTRLYFYSHLSSNDSIALLDTLPFKQIWYLGIDTMFIELCQTNAKICISSIAPHLLRPGEWSVDLVQGRRLWTTRQFLVEPKGL